MVKVEKIAIIIAIIILMWILVSFIDINAHNLTDQQYHPYNFFEIVF